LARLAIAALAEPDDAEIVEIDPPPRPRRRPPAGTRGRVDLHDLRIVRLREGRDGEPRQLDTADKVTVLRILRADLAQLEEGGDA